MIPYRIARLSDSQLVQIESLENEIGVTLIAYEPATTPAEAVVEDPLASSLEHAYGSENRLV